MEVTQVANAISECKPIKIIPQIAIFLNEKSRYRETPTAHGLPAFLCTCFLAKGLCDFKSAYETDADFLFGKYGDSFNDAVH